jgi:Tfp pilus assembly protein PilN
MINVLPPKEKEVLRIEENKKTILILEILGFIFLLCLVLILTSMKIYVSGQAEAARIIFEQEQKEFEVSEIKDFSEKIRLANEIFTNLASFYENQVKLTEVLEETSKIIPEGIQLTSLSYQKKTSEVNFLGFSQDREILIEFKEKLEQGERFEKVYFPSSCWIKPTDIDFNSKFKFKK